MITLLNTETDEQVTWTLQEVLADLNRDRSDGWRNYDESDWQEGLQHFTQWQVVDSNVQGE